MKTDNRTYHEPDTWELSKHSTERITALNDKRRHFVRLELAASTLMREYYKDDPSEKQLVELLNKVASVARARIRTIDDETTDALAEHERIMQKLLEGD